MSSASINTSANSGIIHEAFSCDLCRTGRIFLVVPRFEMEAVMECLLNLKPFPKIFDDCVTDQCGNDGNNKVGDCENVSKGKKQTLAFFIRTLKFSHQKIRIKQKDYESRLDHRSPEWCQPFHSSPLGLSLNRFPVLQDRHTIIN
jgi:hypothetical protein